MRTFLLFVALSACSADVAPAMLDATALPDAADAREASVDDTADTQDAAPVRDAGMDADVR